MAEGRQQLKKTLEHLARGRDLMPLIFLLILLALWPLASKLAPFSLFDLFHYDNSIIALNDPVKPPDVFVLAIDDKSFEDFDQFWPLPASLYADAIESVLDLGAVAVGIDVFFLDEEVYRADSSGYARLETLLAENPNVVIVAPQHKPEDAEDRSRPELIFEATTGYPNHIVDRDGAVRSLEPANTLDDSTQYPLTLMMVARALGRPAGEIISGIPVDHLGFAHFNAYGPPDNPDDDPDRPETSVANMSLSQFLEIGPFLGELVEGKFVLIGAMYPDSKDYVKTSYSAKDGSAEYGVAVHGWTLQTWLDNAWIRSFPISTFYLVGIVAILAGFGAGFFRRTVVGLIALLLFLALSLSLESWLLVNERIWLSASSLVFGSTISWAGTTVIRMVLIDRRRKQLKSVFSKHVSPKVVDELMRRGESIELGGEQREVAVLFSDIRSFTSWSEGKPPHDVVTELNAYFDGQVRCAEDYHGTVNKYIGDAVMVVFGAPLATDKPGLAGMNAAVAMQHAVDNHNQQRASMGRPPFKIGIGVATGPALVGTIGSLSRQEYTVIGATVNLAARLCSAAEGGEVCLCPLTREQCEDVDLEELGKNLERPMKLKGFGDEVPVTVIDVLQLEKPENAG